MLIEPIEESKARSALPSRSEGADGLFSWGLPKLNASTRWKTRLECLSIFFLLPLIGIALDARSAIPFVTGVMLASTIALLSATRNFHWRDLLPVDAFSEWRLVLGWAFAFAVLSFGVCAILVPVHDWSLAIAAAPMLMAFPILTAAPVELVHRVLFFRRFGRLFPNETTALLFGALSNALLYLMLSGTGSGAIFGALIGIAVGRVYLKTGQFFIAVLVHWIAAVSVFVLGPGFLLF